MMALGVEIHTQNNLNDKTLWEGNNDVISKMVFLSRNSINDSATETVTWENQPLTA